METTVARRCARVCATKCKNKATINKARALFCGGSGKDGSWERVGEVGGTMAGVEGHRGKGGGVAVGRFVGGACCFSPSLRGVDARLLPQWRPGSGCPGDQWRDGARFPKREERRPKIKGKRRRAGDGGGKDCNAARRMAPGF